MKIEDILLEVARISILNEFNSSFKIDKQLLQKEFSPLQEQRASFVTINLNGKLRGCIGSLVAHRNLLDDIIHNAHSSAFSDGRFSRLSYEEFKQISIEISVLTPPVKLEYTDTNDLKEKIKPFEHGVILQFENKQATFLPQVWEQLPNVEDFFMHLSHKAGFSESCLSHNPTIYTYLATKIK
jgi:hypothetical protein